MENKPSSLVSNSVEDLMHRIWTTKGARFNAHRRLKTQGQQSIHAISWLSAYLLIFSLTSAIPVFRLTALQAQFVLYGISAMAVLMLVLSVLEGTKEYALKGERLHHCALELARLHDEIKLECDKTRQGKPSTRFLNNASARYQDILMRTSENHETTDYQYFQAQYPAEFQISKFQVMEYKVRWIMRTYGFHKLVILGPPIIAVLLLFYW